MKRSALPLLVCFLSCAALVRAAEPSEPSALAQTLLAKAQIRVGVCELPRIGDGRLAVALAKSGATLVHGLAPEEEAAAVARQAADAAGLLGVRVMVDTGTPSAIPLADWVADLVTVADATDANLKALSPAELWRVMAPYRGTAVVGHPGGEKAGLSRSALEAWARELGGTVEVSEDASGLWAVIRRGPEPGMDEWTHFQHDGGNNPASTDTVFKTPSDIQYITPPFTGAGGSSRFAGGRFFEMEGQQFKHPSTVTLVGKLWCRSAYNGQILWTMDLPRHVEAKQSSIVATADALYMVGGDKPEVWVFDPETGAPRPALAFGLEAGQAKWLAVEGQVLFVLFGPVAPAFAPGTTYHGRNPARGEIVRGKLNHGASILAYDLRANQVLWKHEEKEDLIDNRGVAVGGGRVVFYTEAPRFEDGEDAKRKGDLPSDEPVKGRSITALNVKTGEVLWKNEDARLGALKRKYQFIFGREYYPEMLCTNELIRLRLLGIYQNDIFLIDPQSGRFRKVFDAKEEGTPGTFSGFVADGKYYHRSAILELETGKKVGQVEPDHWGGGCGVRTWSPAGIFGNGGNSSIGVATKSDCHMGDYAAGGLLFSARGWCDCKSVMRGSFAFSPRGERNVHAKPEAYLLVKGEAYAAAADEAANPNDWPVYRRDNDRSGATPSAVPRDAAVLWQHRPEHPYSYVDVYCKYFMVRQDQPSEPVAAGGLIYYGGSDGSVRALDAASGKRIWTYWTGGRVYAPPTYDRGRLYAGSCDGWVYCLEAASGRLAWKFRAAPFDLRILNAMRLENRWPVLGGVLVHGDCAYFAAGFTGAQGLHVFALDRTTGEVKWHTPDAGLRKSELEPGMTADGFMTVSGDYLFLRCRGGLEGRFNLMTGAMLPLPDYRRRDGRMNWDVLGTFGREILNLGEGWILSGGRGLQHELNEREGDRGYESFNMKKFGADGTLAYRARIHLAASAILPPAFDGDGLAFVPSTTQGLHLLDRKKILEQAQATAETTARFEQEKGAQYAPCKVLALEGENAGHRGGMRGYDEMYRESPAFRWAFEDPNLRVNAVVLAGNAVVITRGYTGKDESGRPSNLVFTRWSVAALDRATGKLAWEFDLPCEPMLNGLCIDREGRAIVALRDGGVLCVSAKNGGSGR